MTGTMLPSEYVRELVYDDEATRFITGRWPGLYLTADARDIIHVERTEVTIIGITEDDFYPVVMAEGWSGCCLGFEIMMRLPERPSAWTTAGAGSKPSKPTWRGRSDESPPRHPRRL